MGETNMRELYIGQEDRLAVISLVWGIPEPQALAEYAQMPEEVSAEA